MTSIFQTTFITLAVKKDPNQRITNFVLYSDGVERNSKPENEPKEN